jgi:pimeloyl-ACP methyl ester carboxylesterase
VAAVSLAAAAAWVQYRTRRAEARHPPLGRFLEVDGVRLHYVRTGHGRPVVLLHGNGTMIEDFALSGVLGAAGRRYEVIAFDRPGYGYSERSRDRIWTPEAQADLLSQALTRLGVHNPILVGHSWGAIVAAAWALRHPQQVGGLVLISGYYFPTLRIDVPILSPPALPVVGDLMRYTVSPLIGRLLWPRMVRRLFEPAPVAPSFRRFPAWMALRPGQLRAAASESLLMIPAARRLRHRYRELRLPSLVLAGRDDRLIGTPDQSARLHELLADSELRIVPGVGHMLPHTAPREVLAAIDRVADRVERPRATAAALDIAAQHEHMSRAASAALGAPAA